MIEATRRLTAIGQWLLGLKSCSLLSFIHLAGDVIQIGSSATRVISKWGNTLEGVESYSSRPKSMTIYNSSGEMVYDSPILEDFDGFPILFSHRSSVQKCFYEHGLSIGVSVRLNTRVSEYFEDDDSAGVIVGNEKIRADAVIVCDGIHSYGRRHVTGAQKMARTSGFAVYRSWFPLERLAHNPLTKHLAESKEEQMLTWVGRDTHTNLAVLPKPQGAVVFVTHKVISLCSARKFFTDQCQDDDDGLSESWSHKGNMKAMLQISRTGIPSAALLLKPFPRNL